MSDYKKNSFTIIELLAVITIIAILAAMTIGVYSYIRTKTYNDKTIATIKKVEMAMRSFKHDNGYYIPESNSQNLVINTSNNDLYKYLDYTKMTHNGQINSSGILVDAWGREIIYKNPGDTNRTMFDLISYGKDGNDNSGGGDDITNFTSY